MQLIMYQYQATDWLDQCMQMISGCLVFAGHAKSNGISLRGYKWVNFAHRLFK